MKEELTIRVAKPEDAKGLLEIYAPYVEKTAITFEYGVPSEKEFAGRIRHILTKYPYLVLEENPCCCGQDVHPALPAHRCRHSDL